MGTQDERREKDNFIMLPTVDFCFKELMQNPKVRKGFIAAILGKAPKEVRRTTLVPTALRKESEDDKPGEIYTGQIKEGEDYDKLRKCIHVSILEFVHFPQDKKCCRKIVFCDAETGEQKKCCRKIVFCDAETGEQLALKRIIERQLENGKTEKETADLLGMDIQEVRELAGK